jgi:hypothetical protein
MSEEVKSMLEAVFSELPGPVQKTIQWWITDDEENHSCPLFDISWRYHKAYQKTLPGPQGRKSPSHVQRELSEIQRAFERLEKVLQQDLSPDAEEALLNSSQHLLFGKWLPLRFTWHDYSLMVRGEMRPKGDGSILGELKEIVSAIKAIPKVEKRCPPHSWLIRWTANRIKNGGKPKSHVLPIVQAIHKWAAREEVSEEWGEEYLKRVWPPIR